MEKKQTDLQRRTVSNPSHRRGCYTLTATKLENRQHGEMYWLQRRKGHTSQRTSMRQQIADHMTPTSKDILEQYEALRIWRAAQAWAISRKVSLLRREELETSSDSSWGHEVTAERISASWSLWHEAMSRCWRSGQWSIASTMLLLFNDKDRSCGHLIW